MDIEIRKLVPELAEDYAYFFDRTPHNDEFKHKCYCVSWCSDDAEGERWPVDAAERRAAAIERVKRRQIQGYLAYHNDMIVGWCNANTKSACQRAIGSVIVQHMHAPVVQGEDDAKIKFIFCFTIAPEYRRKGVASRLLDYICDDAKAEGYSCVEVSTQKAFANDGFRGVYEMYQKHGFRIYAEQDGNVVLRRDLG